MATQPVTLLAEAARYAQTRQPEFADDVTTLHTAAPWGLHFREELFNPAIRVIFTSNPGVRGTSEVVLPHVSLFEAAFDQVGGLPESYITTPLARPESVDDIDEFDAVGTIFVASPEHKTLDRFEVSIDPKQLRRWNPTVRLEAWDIDGDDV